MAVHISEERPIDVDKGEIIPSQEICKAAELLLKVVNDPELFGGLCESCVPILHDLLRQLSVLSVDVRIVNNTKEKSTECISNDGKGPSLTLDKSKLWSEEPYSSSETEEESSPSRNLETRDDDSESAVSASKDTKSIVPQLGVTQEVVTTPVRAFKNEKIQFAWANVAISGPETVDDLTGPPTPGKSDEAKDPIQGKLSRERREELRFHGVKRKKDFQCIEWVRGTRMNVVAGLELHTNVFSAVEQRRLIDMVKEYQEKGRNKLLRERTYSEPRKWMRGKGRVTIQFGCCYNYAVDKKGNPPGIIHDELVDPLPNLLKQTIRRLVRWHVLPSACIPDSCIINIYDKGDCIPPHIDHHDFVRPFCTLSLRSECNIVFGSELKIIGPGEFDGPLLIPLPVGSVLVFNGNGADEAKHAIPAVPTQRISITFRKMDPRKVPRGYVVPSDLENVVPF
ncbi:mRNA N6-methyladenine demethylase [Marchantia polymorpha subsp. ruderalis]